MNKLEKFIDSIEEKTKSNTIHWEAISPSRRDDVIPNARFCTKIFESELNGRKLLAVEKKVPTLDHDLEEYFDTYDFNFILLNNNQVELMITDDEVSRGVLYNLMDTISRKTFGTDDFLNEVIG